jgi:transcriptional regulator with XRE-family HTH domain
MTKETIGARIQRVREDRGLSASELSRLVEVTPTAVWNWENNGTQPRPDALLRIAKVLGVSRDYLVSGGGTIGFENSKTVAEVTENARAQIAKLMGLSPDRVKLHVQFETE